MATRVRVVWSDEALTDLARIHDSIARHSGAYRIVYELREGRAEVLTVFRASRLFPRDLHRAE
ncbi:MAG TPA: hypothetical protein VF048_05175 [Gemmatimonadaceae bacterium]